MEADYRFDLPFYEGPLDLLLYLVKKEEVDIYDIPIEKITTQYVEYIETFKTLNIGLAAEFIVMAANLMYIKSRMLLPKHQQPPEDDADEDDPRWDLIRQLIEYKKFKDAADKLGEAEAAQQEIFGHTPEKIQMAKDEERPLADVNMFDLIKAFQNILDRFDKGDLGEVFDDRFTVADKIQFITDLIPPGESRPFSSLFEGAASKGEVIVTFLAMLELMKINSLKITQDKLLGDIMLFRNENE